MFTRAIVRPPAENFFQGLTTADFGVPDYALALRQHEAYCAALEHCGLELTKLDPDPRYPDSTFVEDAAIVLSSSAVLTRPGAPSRLGEVESLRDTLVTIFPALLKISSPGTLDGGDICEAGDHFFIGISERTNQAGADQLATMLADLGHTSSMVDIRRDVGMLHLKSGLAYLGDGRLVVTEAIANLARFSDYEMVPIGSDEEYAANCVRVNDFVLVAAGYPAFQSKLEALGYRTIALEMSEFQKMDGGLSCLSLRF